MADRHSYIINGITLHSTYNPDRQAERFLETNLKSMTRTLIIVGAGFGFIVNQAKKTLPYAKIIGIHATGSGDVSDTSTGWSPDSEISLHNFLSDNLHYTDLVGMDILYWSPGCRILEKLFPEYMNIISGIISKLQMELATIGSFGKKYLYNTIKKSKMLRGTQIDLPAKPVLIVAPGPSLDEQLIDIKKHKKDLLIFATSSALEPLLLTKIKPDAIICIDAGFFAAQLLTPLLIPGDSNLDIPIFCSPQASVPINIMNPVYIFGDQQTPEGKLAQRFSFGNTPSMGTVTAAAVMFCESIGISNVLFAGLNLGNIFGKSHVNFHHSSNYDLQHSNRYAPFSSRQHQRISSGSLAMKTYMDWFSGRNRARPGSMFSLSPNPAGIEIIKLEKFLMQPKPKINIDKHISTTNMSEQLFQMKNDVISCIEQYKITNSLPHYPHPGLEELIYTALPKIKDPFIAYNEWHNEFIHLKDIHDA